MPATTPPANARPPCASRSYPLTAASAVPTAPTQRRLHRTASAPASSGRSAGRARPRNERRAILPAPRIPSRAPPPPPAPACRAHGRPAAMQAPRAPQMRGDFFVGHRQEGPVGTGAAAYTRLAEKSGLPVLGAGAVHGPTSLSGRSPSGAGTCLPLRRTASGTAQSSPAGRTVRQQRPGALSSGAAGRFPSRAASRASSADRSSASPTRQARIRAASLASEAGDVTAP